VLVRFVDETGGGWHGAERHSAGDNACSSASSTRQKCRVLVRFVDETKWGGPKGCPAYDVTTRARPLRWRDMKVRSPTPLPCSC